MGSSCILAPSPLQIFPSAAHATYFSLRHISALGSSSLGTFSRRSVHPGPFFGCSLTCVEGRKSVSERSRRPARIKISRAVSEAASESTVDAPAREGKTIQSLWEREVEVGDGMFDWMTSWYPVAIAADIDKKRPLQVTVLGRQYVVWWDWNSTEKGGGGQWQVFADLCPHRLAPLSEGRIHESGALQCSYHGWTFLGDASCSSIPQAPAEGPPVHAKARACAIRHPCEERYGFVWMIPSSTPKAWEKARESGPPSIPAFEDPSLLWIPGMRDVAYGYDTLVENVTDPSHVPFAHHGIQGNRNKPRPVTIKVEDCGPHGFSGQTGSGLAVFTAPSMYMQNFRIPRKDGKPLIANVIAFFVPTMPGHSRLFWAFPSNMRKRLPPRWLDHVTNRLRIVDSDLYLLHYQDRAVGSLPKLERRTQAYYTPTAADGFVESFRRWYEMYAGGSPPWAPGVDTRIPPLLPKEILLERYHSHVVHCASCKGAYDNIERIKVCLQVAAFVILGGLVANVARGGASFVNPSWALSLLALSGAFLLLSKKLDSYLQDFFRFKDYIHAYIK